MTSTPDDLERLIAEIAAAPTRAEAEDVFAGADWIFVRMHPAAREIAYTRIDDLIQEKEGAP